MLCLFATIAAQALTPEVVIQNQSAYRAIAFSPDGQRLAAVGTAGIEAGALQLWDLSTGKLQREVPTRGAGLTGVAFTPDGNAVATCCTDGGAELWDARTGVRRLVLSPNGCYALALSPDGRFAALQGTADSAQSYSMCIKLVSLADGKVIRSFKTSLILSLAFSTDGQTLVSGEVEGVVRVWDVATGVERFGLKGHQGQVKSVSVSADDALIASADDKTVRIWDLKTGKALRVEAVKTYGSISFSPGGHLLYRGVVLDNLITERQLVEEPSGKVMQVLRGPQLFPYSGAFSANGELLAVSGSTTRKRMEEGCIELWKVRTGRFLRDLRSMVRTPAHVAFAPQGHVLAVEGEQGVRLFDLTTLRPAPLQNPERTDCNSGNGGLAFTPSGATLLAGLNCGRLDLLSLKGVPLGVLTPPTPTFLEGVALSPDGNTVGALGTSCLGLKKGACRPGVVVWDLASRKVKWTFPSDQWLFRSRIAFSPDGKQLAFADKAVQLLDAETGVLLSSRRITYRGAETIKAEPKALAYAKDGRLAVGSSFGNVVEFASPDDHQGRSLAGKAIVTSEGPASQICELRYSPDATCLVAGSDDGLLLFLNGSPQKAFRAHAGAITSMAFSPDGRLLATAGVDAAVRIWEASTALLLATLVQVADDDYIFVTPAGTYCASPGAFSGVAFRVGERVYPFEQFDLQLNRPDEVLRTLGTGSQGLVDVYHRAWLKRLRRMGLGEKDVALDTHAPMVSLLTKDLGVATHDPVITLRVRVEDGLVPLDHLKIMVNDVPLGGAGGVALDKRTGILEVPIQIPLSSGVNRVRISAVNARAAESVSETFEIMNENPVSPPAIYVLAIGVSEYENKAYNLQYAAKDASDLAAVFDHGEGGASAKVMRILDKAATRDHILAAKSFLAQAGVDDTVIVFLAGHGLLDDNLDYFFATTDIDAEHPAKRGLPFQAFEDLLDGLASRRKLMLVDTCNSGELDPEAAAFRHAGKVDGGVVQAHAVRGLSVRHREQDVASSRERVDELFSDLRRGSGAAIIASTSGAAFAFESDQFKNGVFTYSVLNGLLQGGADANGDGRVTVSELRDYVISNVQRLTGGAQRPTSRRESLAFDFEITPEDLSLRRFQGVTWDSPGICVGAPDPDGCAALVREARNYFPDPLSWLQAVHQVGYASRHGRLPPPERDRLLAIHRALGQPRPGAK